MPDENDIQLTRGGAGARTRGQALIAAPCPTFRAPQSLREAVERERERAATRARTPFWRRRRLGLALASAAAVALAVVVIVIRAPRHPASRRWRRCPASPARRHRARSDAPSAARLPNSTPGSATLCSPTGRRSSAGRLSAVATTPCPAARHDRPLPEPSGRADGLRSRIRRHARRRPARAPRSLTRGRPTTSPASPGGRS